MINRSTYYDGKTFKHEGREVKFSRVWGGVSFHGHFLVLIGEEQFFSETHYYVLCEVQVDDLSDMPQMMRRLESEYKTEQWIGTMDDNLVKFFKIRNIQSAKEGLRTTWITDAPRIKETIDTQVDLVIGLLKPHKRLHFFGQSMLPAAMHSTPTQDIKAKEHPQMEALANVISGLLQYTHEDIPVEFLIPQEMPDY